MTTAPRRRHLPALLLILAIGLSLITATASTAAEPDSGTVGPDAPTVTWTGAPSTPAFPTTEGICPPTQLDPDQICDTFLLTVDVEPSFWDGKNGAVRIEMSFPDGVDYELAVYRPGNPVPVASAATASSPEVVVLPKASGDYEVKAIPYTNPSADPYEAIAEFTVLDAVDPISPGFQSYRGTAVDAPPSDPEGDLTNPEVAFEGEKLAFRSTDVGRKAAEPTIGVDKEGVAFYAAGDFDALPSQAPTNLARTEIRRSTDGGLTWEDVTPRIGGQNTHPTTLDPYVYVEEDTGRVFNLDLTLVDKYLSFSDDQGETWTQAAPADPTNLVNDHQTIFSGPVPEGFSAPLLTDYPEIVYYCFNKVVEAVCSRSLDGGLTFSRTGAPAFPGFDPAIGELCGGLHGHIATDSEGRLFLPKGHCGNPWVAISEDAGTSWAQVKVSELGFPEQQASIAADAADNLYYVWYDDVQRQPYLATSTDHGQTWSDAINIAPPGVTEVQWPTVAAGDEGRITVGFPCTRATGELAKSVTRPWDYCITVSTDALEAEPTFASNITNDPQDPVHRGECPGRCGNMYDFLDVIVAPQEGGGDIWAAYTDTCTDIEVIESAGEDSTENTDDDELFPICNQDPNAPGFDGSADNAAADMRGMATRQVSGPRMFASSDATPPAGGEEPAPQPAPQPAPSTDPSTDPAGSPLPATGGGLAVGAVALLGTAGLLRRRRT